MPAKMVRSAFLPSFGVPAVTAVVPALSLSCQNAGGNAKCTQNMESYGESRLKCPAWRRRPR
jgi:hypothetical protein